MLVTQMQHLKDFNTTFTYLPEAIKYICFSEKHSNGLLV